MYIISFIHIAFYIPGCQGDNGCIKKGSEVSAEGCIKYICNKKGDLEILSVGEFCGIKKGDLEILSVGEFCGNKKGDLEILSVGEFCGNN